MVAGWRSARLGLDSTADAAGCTACSKVDHPCLFRRPRCCCSRAPCSPPAVRALSSTFAAARPIHRAQPGWCASTTAVCPPRQPAVVVATGGASEVLVASPAGAEAACVVPARRSVMANVSASTATPPTAGDAPSAVLPTSRASSARAPAAAGRCAVMACAPRPPQTRATVEAAAMSVRRARSVRPACV